MIIIKFLRGFKVLKDRLENKTELGISVKIGFLRSHLILERKIRHLYNISVLEIIRKEIVRKLL